MMNNRETDTDALDAYSRAVTTAAERVGPAVVRIDTDRGRPRLRGWPPRPEGGSGLGSGVIFASDGQVLTNAHVVEGAQRIQVTLADGRKFAAGLLGIEPEHDLAVLRIGARNLPVAELGHNALRVGQLVIAIGNPYGLGWTVTAGVVSALGRELPTPDGHKLTKLIQSDTPINPGNSGGPLVDSQNHVVGITTAMVPFGQGLGFSISLDTIKDFLGRVHRLREPHQGISIGVGGMKTEIDERLVRQLRLTQRNGMLLLEVRTDGPAAQGGLRMLDVIIAADDQPVLEPKDLQRMVARHQRGETLTITFLREDKQRRVTLKL
ncbi:MAG TPA: trypsin-like peptidase domain-containing protein [Ktedonobacterales bacterium]|nr:trypsin-like peptidase domain-containing protein [Ktedonobacterales bacterium]